MGEKSITKLWLQNNLDKETNKQIVYQNTFNDLMLELRDFSTLFSYEYYRTNHGEEFSIYYPPKHVVTLTQHIDGISVHDPKKSELFNIVSASNVVVGSNYYHEYQKDILECIKRALLAFCIKNSIRKV